MLVWLSVWLSVCGFVLLAAVQRAWALVMRRAALTFALAFEMLGKVFEMVLVKVLALVGALVLVLGDAFALLLVFECGCGKGKSVQVGGAVGEKEGAER